MQVNLASALGLFGIGSRATDDAKVAAGLTPEVQAKALPPTAASMAIDEAIAGLLEAELAQPESPPILQPNKSFFEAPGKQPIADQKQPDEEWDTDKPLKGVELRTASAADTRPPILQPGPNLFVGKGLDLHLTNPKYDSNSQGERKPPVLYAKPEGTDLFLRNEPALASAAGKALTVTLPNGETFVAESASEDGVVTTPSGPMRPFDTTPFGRSDRGIRNDTESAKPHAPAVPIADAPRVSPFEKLREDRPSIKILDRLQRMLDRVAPEAKVTLIALRDSAIVANNPIEKVVASLTEKVRMAMQNQSASEDTSQTESFVDAIRSQRPTVKLPLSSLMERILGQDRIDKQPQILLPRGETFTTESSVTDVARTLSVGAQQGAARSDAANAQTAVADAKLTTAVMTRVIDRIHQMVESRKPQTVTIRLDPPELGSIDITVKSVNGRVDAQIAATNSEVRQFVDANRAMLAQALADHGLELGSMSVGGQSHGQSQAQDSNQASGPAWRPDIDASAAQSGTLSAASYSMSAFDMSV